RLHNGPPRSAELRSASRHPPTPSLDGGARRVECSLILVPKLVKPSQNPSQDDRLCRRPSQKNHPKHPFATQVSNFSHFWSVFAHLKSHKKIAFLKTLPKTSKVGPLIAQRLIFR
ncbi:MAG: hypothetical protein VYB60_09755, partial [SAR324 cluster bacterium]|nr:hypothetical protein [SAR324 cluster bacterium]